MWKRIADDAWVVQRAAANLLNGSTAAGRAWALARGGHCSPAKGLMTLCTGMNGGVPPGGHAFTIGNVVMTEDTGLRPGELAHETKHANQWAVLGLSFVPDYFTAMGISEGTNHGQFWNVFEANAGFKGGGYSC